MGIGGQGTRNAIIQPLSGLEGTQKRRKFEGIWTPQEFFIFHKNIQFWRKNMTIPYQFDIASSKTWSFIKVICRWRGSVWKSVIVELFLWLAIYYAIFILYRFILDQEQQKFFAELANYTYSTTEYLPLTFMLGFFVKIVVDRWRDMFEHIGFIDSAAFSVANLIQGNDEESIRTRRNILRYLCLSQVLLLRDISIKVRRRFPTIESVVQAGFSHEHEMRQMVDARIEDFYWMPVNWACALTHQMREKGKIIGDPQQMMVLKSILDFQRKLQALCNYDWVPVPIAYPQVVFVTIRVYFLICCISRQFIIGGNGEIVKHRNFDLLFPFMTVLQFIFYMGWMKVAEALLNPFGEDDDDFESNFIIDRNVTLAMFVSSHPKIPEQKADLLHPELGLLYSEQSMGIANNLLSNSVKQLELDKTDKTKREDGTVKMVRKPTVVNVDANGPSANLFGKSNGFNAKMNGFF